MDKRYLFQDEYLAIPNLQCDSRLSLCSDQKIEHYPWPWIDAPMSNEPPQFELSEWINRLPLLQRYAFGFRQQHTRNFKTSLGKSINLDHADIPVLSGGAHDSTSTSKIGKGVDHTNLIQIIGRPSVGNQPTFAKLKYPQTLTQGVDYANLIQIIGRPSVDNQPTFAKLKHPQNLVQ